MTSKWTWPTWLVALAYYSRARSTTLSTVLHKMIFPTGQPKARVPNSHWQTLALNPETLGFR